MIFMEAAQALGGERLVRLFALDLSPLGDNTVLRFCKNNHEAAVDANGVFQNGYRLRFDGWEYEPVDIEATGFEWSGSGPLPQPTVRISNINMASGGNALLSGLLRDYSDLIGARLYSYKTFARFLDGGPDASLAASAYTLETYIVERKVAHNNLMIEFKLSSAMDQQGRMLPGRVVLRDTCMWRYRVWRPAAGAFDYSKATCPYTGGAMFDAFGNAVGDPAKDVCSKHVQDGCKKRFGNLMPFGGFPGVARTR